MNHAVPADPTPYIPIVVREGAALVRRYDVSGDARVSLLHQSENTMLLVNDARRGRKLVLRIHSQRLAYHGALSIASELQWMTALRRDSDVEVPEVVPAKDGSLVQTIAASDLDLARHAVMFSFLDGAEPTEDVMAETFAVLGEITGRMHRHAARWRPPAGFIRHHWNCATILGDEPLWGRWRDGMGVDRTALEILGRLADTIQRRLDRLGGRREIYGLIHADMRLANLLVEGERTKVIDFDDCGFGWTMYDLATALSFLEGRPHVPELIDSWLSGYRTATTLPRDMEIEFPTIMMLRRLAEIAWLGTRRHLDFAQSLGAGFTGNSCRLAEDYLSRFG